jgi:hypothetical protein
MLDGGKPMELAEGEKVYIFMSNKDSISKTMGPTSQFPMVQSYVDRCINGCLVEQGLGQ